MRYLLIPVVLLSACTTTYTHPDNKSQAEFDRDWYYCEQVGERRAADWGNSGNIFVMNDFTKECMEREKGWRPTSGSGGR